MKQYQISAEIVAERNGISLVKRHTRSKIMQKKCKNMHISVQKYLTFKQKRAIIENRWNEERRPR